MKKREFLAVGGAMPLVLAGCGGSSTGTAPVRLVNASVGYSSLGFSVAGVAAASGVAYGAASPIESVQAGSVTTALTITDSGGLVSTVASSTRNLSKDARYSLVAYGFKDELKSVLITESTKTPDTGNANVNVLNTSVDIGLVDVFVSKTLDLSLATQIAAGVGSSLSPAQSGFFGVATGDYYITVTGQSDLTDIRFQSPATVNLANPNIYTIILTPGASGTLANAILLQQGDPGATTSFLNTTARLRIVSGVPAGTSVAVAGVVTLTKPNFTEYATVSTGAAPIVTVGATQLPPLGTLAAGGDYTLLVYNDTTGAPTGSLLLDDNTAPTGTLGVKFRLINLATTDTLALTVDSVYAASGVGFGQASAYRELAEAQGDAQHTLQVLDGSTVLKTWTQLLQAGRIFTEVVYDITTTPPGEFFLAPVN